MKLEKFLWPVAAVLMVGIFLFQARAEPGAKNAMQAGAKLVDVRTPGEFSEGHLPGAVNIPLDELSRRIGEVGAQDKEVVVYCRSGKRSARAKQILQDAGFEHVHDLGAMSNGE